MYKDHVPYIASAMQSDPDAFARGAMFAVLSIQQMFITVPKALLDVERNEDTSRFLFGHKAGAYRYIMDHKRELHANVASATTPGEAIARLCVVPGLGVVKAGFIAQLMGHDVACLDTRNIQREKRNPREYRSDGERKKATPAFARKIGRYVADVGGRAQAYWDNWCTDVSKTYGMTPEAVSKVHLDCIVKDKVEPIAVPFFRLNDDMPF